MKSDRDRFIERLTLPENLYWAWHKLKNHYRVGDVWFDEAEVARFESCLHSELSAITNQFKDLSYEMGVLTPLPHPKKKDALSGKAQTRQAFWVNVRDQVAWLAFVNIVGPGLDCRMPSWSYGSRLYRTVWIDEEEERLKKLGM